MAKVRGVEAKLSRLRALRKESVSPEWIAELRSALGDRSNLVAAAVAEIVGERQVAELADDLVAAFDRFMIEPQESDKNCPAKIAIVEALNKIDYEREEVFLKAIHHVQIEPRWPRDEDSAGPLRGNGAFGLVRIRYRGVMHLLVELLLDKEKVARCAAAQALGGSALAAAVPLLRFKVRVGDEEPEVIGDCLSALMEADPKDSLEFVTEYLRGGPDAIREGAAFALAESRRPEALDVLKAEWPRAKGSDFEEALLLAISMTRLPAALEFLLGILATDAEAGATALSALAIHRHNDSLKARVAAIIEKSTDMKLRERFRKKFDTTA
jgi:hypothetical protein